MWIREERCLARQNIELGLIYEDEEDDDEIFMNRVISQIYIGDEHVENVIRE